MELMDAVLFLFVDVLEDILNALITKGGEARNLFSTDAQYVKR